MRFNLTPMTATGLAALPGVPTVIGVVDVTASSG